MTKRLILTVAIAAILAAGAAYVQISFKDKLLPLPAMNIGTKAKTKNANQHQDLPNPAMKKGLAATLTNVSPYEIAEKGTPADMAAYLANNPDFELNRLSPQGRTLLSLAVDNPDYHMAEVVLERGANPNLADTAFPEAAPLAAAVHSRRFPAAYRLLQAGANPNALVPGVGETPLSLAAGEDCGDVRFLGMLKEFGADDKQLFENGETLLMRALRGDPCLATVKLLLEWDADVNAVSNDGYSVLMYALRFARDTRIIALLLDAGANKSYIAPDGQSAVDIARNANRCDETIALLENVTPKPIEE